jgi:hypothetical protein
MWVCTTVYGRPSPNNPDGNRPGTGTDNSNDDAARTANTAGDGNTGTGPLAVPALPRYPTKQPDEVIAHASNGEPANLFCTSTQAISLVDGPVESPVDALEASEASD